MFELYSKIQERNRLTVENLGLARLAASRISRKSQASYEELQAQANLLLVQAIQRYDPSKGTAISTFIVPFIQYRLLNEVSRRGWLVRLPRRDYEIVQKAKKLNSKGRKLSQEELSEEIGITPKRLREAEEALRACKYLKDSESCFDLSSPKEDRRYPASSVSIAWGNVKPLERKFIAQGLLVSIPNRD